MLFHILAALLLAALALWALKQLTPEPLDATMSNIIRVVIIVVTVLFCFSAATGHHYLGALRR